MLSEWKEYSLGDIFNVKHGFAFKGEFFTDETTKTILVTPGNFSTNGGFQNPKPKYYNGPVPQDYILSPGQIVVTMTDLSKQADTLGYAAVVPNDDDIWLHNQRVGLLEFKDDVQSDSLFIQYLLRKHEYRAWVVGSATGTTVKHTSPGRIMSYRCKLPPLPEQKAIAHILGSLDDKIELNRKMNETLEAMAQAMFKSWFVDFDPVIDNAIAVGNTIPEELAERAEQRKALGDKRKKLAPEIQKLFPNEFIFTDELGWIPKGWEVKNSEELFDVKDGTHDSPKQAESGKYLITSRHITGETIDFSKAYLISDEDFEQVNRRSKVDTFDTLLTMIGTVGEPFLVMKDEINFAIKNIGLFKTSVDKKMAIFFYLYLKTTFMKNFFESRIAGTTQKYLTLKILRTLPVLSASLDIMELFGGEVIPAFEKNHANNKNISELSKLRDTLLPKLLSGELRIKNAEKSVEGI